MGKYLPFIKSAIHILESEELLVSLERMNNFHDEPKLHHFAATLKYYSLPNNNKTLNTQRHIVGQGYSFHSAELALAKCLGESLERISLYKTIKSQIKSFEETSGHNDLSAYKHIKVNPEKLNWVEGLNLLTEEKSALPAQLAYIDYLSEAKEPMITEPNTSGGAGYISKSEAILAGIYELVERDAFMTMYLNKISPPRINTDIIQNKRISNLIAKCERYLLKIYSFQITNDLEIPAFMSVTVDTTKYGPAISVGLRAGFNKVQALYESMEESFISHRWTRQIIYKNIAKELIPNRKVISLTDRGLFWSPFERTKDLSFILNQEPTIEITTPKNPVIDELKSVLRVLDYKYYHPYVIDITPQTYKIIPYYVVKVIIPELQPLYLNEKNRELRHIRLKKVAEFFHHKTYSLNSIPHPFI